MKKYLLLAALFCTVSAMAQYIDYSHMGKTPNELKFIDEPMKIERKESDWWRFSPVKDTAPEQLAFAQTLEMQGRTSRAITAYDRLVRYWHASDEALTAQLSIARLETQLGNEQEAFDADIYLLAYFAGRFKLEPVLIDAMTHADYITTANETQKFIGIRKSSRKAMRANYEQLIHFAPRWERVPELLTRIAELYSADGNEASAITIYDRIIVKWPTYDKMNDIVYRYCQSCRNLATTWANDTGRLLHLENLLKGAQEHYPDHPEKTTFTIWQCEVFTLRQEATYKQALFYDNAKAYDLESAIIAYDEFIRQFPNAHQVDTARERVAQLRAKLASAKSATPAK